MHAFLLRRASDILLTICRFTSPKRKGGREKTIERRTDGKTVTMLTYQIERNTGAIMLDVSIEKLQFFFPRHGKKTASAIFSGKLAFAEKVSPET